MRKRLHFKKWPLGCSVRGEQLPREMLLAVAGMIVSTLLVAVIVWGCGQPRAPKQTKSQPAVVFTRGQNSILIESPTAQFELLGSGYLQARLKAGGKLLSLDEPEAGTPANAEYVKVEGKDVRDFSLDLSHATISDSSDTSVARVVAVGHSATLPTVQQTLTIELSDKLPSMAVVRSVYRNTGSSAVSLDRVVAQQHRFSEAMRDHAPEPYGMWSFEGASVKWGLNELTPLTKDFSRENRLQEVIPGSPGTGGGIPVNAFWDAEVGEAIGHIEPRAVRAWMPVQVRPDGRVQTSLQFMPDSTLSPGAEYETPPTFLAVYHGDYYEPLRMYSEALAMRGWHPAKPNASAYKPNWCGWGYELNFTAAQMINTIPKLKLLGIQWATLDAGWFNNRGDWEPRADLRGGAMKDLVDKFHQQGIRLTLWWIPIVAEDGHGTDILDNKPYKTSEVVKQHPDWLILNKDGKPARMTSDMAGLCPAMPEVKEYYRQLTLRFIRDWGFDGHKLDFSFATPRCYNPKHHHQSADESTRAMGDVYKIIFDTTMEVKPDAVQQICPCGTPPNFAWLPYLNQAVTADPVGSAQVRRRIKMYKALLGPSAAVYGDHVELTNVRNLNTEQEQDEGRDFASTIGPGGVPGTKFTWPDYGTRFHSVQLTDEKESVWKKWLTIYQDKMLSQGTFRNLYVYGYDFPEAYAIAKDGKMYYAFFAPEPGTSWEGTLELRGLSGADHFRVMDYEAQRDLGMVTAPDFQINTKFNDHLLLEVSRP